MFDGIPFYEIIRECSFSVKMFLFFSTIVENEGQNGVLMFEKGTPQYIWQIGDKNH
jgi:hypothetical protein